jgi:PAS domain S-box-containing protein
MKENTESSRAKLLPQNTFLEGNQNKLILPVVKEEDIFRVINELEDYAFIILDKNGIITTWNKGAEKIKGYTAKEIIGKHYRIFYSKEDKEAHLPEKVLQEATSEGKAEYEGWRIRKNGSRFWGSITLSAIYDNDRKIIGYVKVTRDLTEKKIAEEQFSNVLEELRQRNQELHNSEIRYHKMIDEVQDYAIILLDKDGRVADWNKGAEKLKGYRPDEIMGKSFRLFYPKDDKAAKLPEKLLDQAVRNGSVLHEGWRVKKDGTRFWGSVAITALHDDNRNIIGFSKVTRDLTDRKIAEDQLMNIAEFLRQKNEELRQSEQRYYKMIEEVEDYAIILLTQDGRIENWNVGAELIKGYKAEEIVGKSFKLFYTEEDCKNKVPEKILEEATMHGKSIHEGLRVRKDGSTFWGNVVVTALHDINGKLIGFSKVTRDLTERKKAEDALKANARELNEKNKTLERLNAELSSFTYVASHDLKEPLRKIQIFSERLQESQSLSAEALEYLTKIRSTTSRMKRLIDDLLSLSQVSNLEDTVLEEINLNTLIGTVKNDLDIAISEKKATIKYDKLPVVSGRQFQFHQLFLNLISNALKFSKADVPPVITISAKKVKGSESKEPNLSRDQVYHLITVEDNGIGFEAAYSKKIFNAFQRLHPKTEISGTGIGLAIVKKIVDNHDGTIIAEGRPDAGAIFKIYLPIDKDEVSSEATKDI